MCINYRVDTYYRDVSIDDVCVRKRLAAKSLFLANVNALARDETGGGEVPGIPVPGPEGWTRGTCQSMVEIGI